MISLDDQPHGIIITSAGLRLKARVDLQSLYMLRECMLQVFSQLHHFSYLVPIEKHDRFTALKPALGVVSLAKHFLQG